MVRDPDALLLESVRVLRDTGGSGRLMAGERSEGQVFPGTYAEQLPPGRGRLQRRGERPTLVQVAHTPEVRHAP